MAGVRVQVGVEKRKRQRSDDDGIFLVLLIEGINVCDIGELKDERALTIWHAWRAQETGGEEAFPVQPQADNGQQGRTDGEEHVLPLTTSGS
jgi:hypothetical protein